MKYTDIELVNNETSHSFEIFIDDHRAFIDYKQKGDHVYLIHTEVPVELRGRGIADALVEKTLKYLEQHQLKLIPLCVFVQAYLKRYPEWDKLLLAH
ncbi:N-acetyltransferase [Inquilinus sp. KBS0705]|nr:N-acetyltransferase [Inquilinus sp. KBS0705]